MYSRFRRSPLATEDPTKILADVAITRAAIRMIPTTLSLEEKDPGSQEEGKSPLCRRTSRSFADKLFKEVAKSPIAPVGTALLCLSGLRRAALDLPYLDANRCSKRVPENAPDSLPLSHTLPRRRASSDMDARSFCKQIRFCQAHHVVCPANGLAEPGDEFELYTQWPRPAARGRGALNAQLPSANCSKR